MWFPSTCPNLLLPLSEPHLRGSPTNWVTWRVLDPPRLKLEEERTGGLSFRVWRFPIMPRSRVCSRARSRDIEVSELILLIDTAQQVFCLG